MNKLRTGPVFIALLVLVALPSRAEAHLRWFVDSQGSLPDQHYTMDLTIWLIIAGTVLFFAFSVWVGRACSGLPMRKQLVGAAPVVEPVMWRMVAGLAGLMLIINTMMHDYLAPNLSLPEPGVMWVGLIAQGLVGVLLLGQISFTVSGVLIYVAAALAAMFNAPMLLLDYLFEFAALGLALIFVGPQLTTRDRRVFDALKIDPDRYRHLPLPIIRVGVGITLIILAVHNKLADPSMSVAFLQQYDLNFMPHIGFPGFTDLHFAFSAGVAELAIGILILFGFATRFVVFVLAIFFVCTLVVLPPLELIGHLPLFGIAFLMITCGGGRFRLAGEPISK